MPADLRDVLGKRIIDAARIAAALHLQASVELTRRNVVIGGADQDRSTDGPFAAGMDDPSPAGSGGTRFRLWSADGVGE